MVANLERGTKRQCLYCGTKFYDLNHDPILCPSCGKVFVFNAVKAPARPVPEVKKEEAEVVDTAAVEAGAEVISLDDAEEEEGDDIPDVEDVEVDDELGGDDEDVFLEQDDDEDDDIDFSVKDDDDD